MKNHDDFLSLFFFFFFLGIPVTKPDEVKGLLALGGPEESSGYKGYGLSMMVEILCGILSGQSYVYITNKHSVSH